MYTTYEIQLSLRDYAPFPYSLPCMYQWSRYPATGWRWSIYTCFVGSRNWVVSSEVTEVGCTNYYADSQTRFAPADGKCRCPG